MLSTRLSSSSKDSNATDVTTSVKKISHHARIKLNHSKRKVESSREASRENAALIPRGGRVTMSVPASERESR
eukprot:scaffold129586_cov63-Phaeocystis_antarctica.AAC.2